MTPQTLGKYTLHQPPIGQGGFSTVYRAEDSHLGRTVALKVLDPLFLREPDFVQRFELEARTAARLQHPHIVTIYEIVAAESQLAIAMQYVPGQDLGKLLRQAGALPPERALVLLHQIAAALDYAHGCDVVHRDLKPANILVKPAADGDERAMLTDFGLVRVLSASASLSASSAGRLLGSPEYMAPEQCDPNRGSEVGPASDRYAFGVVAYQVFAGRVPFPGATSATINAHLNLAPPDPRQFAAGIPPTAAAVILKMLAKAPGDRYNSAQAFVRALAAAYGQMPPPARRGYWVAGGGAVAVLALIIALFWPRFAGVAGRAPVATATPMPGAAVAAIPTGTTSAKPGTAASVAPSATVAAPAAIPNEAAPPAIDWDTASSVATPPAAPADAEIPTATLEPTPPPTETLRPTLSPTPADTPTPSATHTATPRPTATPTAASPPTATLRPTPLPAVAPALLGPDDGFSVGSGDRVTFNWAPTLLTENECVELVWWPVAGAAADARGLVDARTTCTTNSLTLRSEALPGGPFLWSVRVVNFTDRVAGTGFQAPDLPTLPGRALTVNLDSGGGGSSPQPPPSGYPSPLFGPAP